MGFRDRNDFVSSRRTFAAADRRISARCLSRVRAFYDFQRLFRRPKIKRAPNAGSLKPIFRQNQSFQQKIRVLS